jgi:hypothetical protein
MTTTIVPSNFATLLESASLDRPSHVNSKFIRIDLWGSAFEGDLRFRDYQDNANAKKYWSAVAVRVSTKKRDLLVTPGRGKRTGTWVHPLIASHYAAWLNADFAVAVNETFLKVIEGDADLGAELILRDHNKDRQKKALKRVKVALSNTEINALSHKHGLPYYKLHDDRSVGLYGKTTKQLREIGGVEKETPLNYMSDLDISYADAANAMVIESDNPALMALAASGIADLHQRITGKKLEPTWDSERLTPAKARKITHSKEYQMQLTV